MLEFDHDKREPGSYSESFNSSNQLHDGQSHMNGGLKRSAPHDDDDKSQHHQKQHHCSKGSTSNESSSSSEHGQEGEERRDKCKDSDLTAIDRRVLQNRAAQRAFRQRKERYVRELEEKVSNLMDQLRSYEQMTELPSRHRYPSWPNPSNTAWGDPHIESGSYPPHRANGKHRFTDLKDYGVSNAQLKEMQAEIQRLRNESQELRTREAKLKEAIAARDLRNSPSQQTSHNQQSSGYETRKFPLEKITSATSVSNNDHSNTPKSIGRGDCSQRRTDWKPTPGGSSPSSYRPSYPPYGIYPAASTSIEKFNPLYPAASHEAFKSVYPYNSKDALKNPYPPTSNETYKNPYPAPSHYYTCPPRPIDPLAERRPTDGSPPRMENGTSWGRDSQHLNGRYSTHPRSADCYQVDGPRYPHVRPPQHLNQTAAPALMPLSSLGRSIGTAYPAQSAGTADAGRTNSGVGNSAHKPQDSRYPYAYYPGYPYHRHDVGGRQYMQPYPSPYTAPA
ncbi:hypothetical protein HDU67_000409 [Dinochytrium kinnereticum]|nr:hypothetical protein HDU67_000409 [Dinochytrium kinnereticum]